MPAGARLAVGRAAGGLAGPRAPVGGWRGGREGEQGQGRPSGGGAGPRATLLRVTCGGNLGVGSFALALLHKSLSQTSC